MTSDDNKNKAMKFRSSPQTPKKQGGAKDNRRDARQDEDE